MLSQRPPASKTTAIRSHILFQSASLTESPVISSIPVNWMTKSAIGPTKKSMEFLLIQCRRSGCIQLLPCNIESMTGKAAAKWCARTWMGGWDVPSEVIRGSGKEYTSEWWRTLCTRLGIHHLRCEIHSHGALPGERAGRSLIDAP